MVKLSLVFGKKRYVKYDVFDDENYGKNQFILFGKGLPLQQVMNIVVPICNSIIGHIPLRQLKKYYIKTYDGLYLNFNTWHSETKLEFTKEKGKKSKWFIEMKPDGKITITPSGGKQYNWFAIDIPNATQKTNKIPMWIFIKNNTNAQKFFLHKVKR